MAISAEYAIPLTIKIIFTSWLKKISIIKSYYALAQTQAAVLRDQVKILSAECLSIFLFDMRTRLENYLSHECSSKGLYLVGCSDWPVTYSSFLHVDNFSGHWIAKFINTNLTLWILLPTISNNPKVQFVFTVSVAHSTEKLSNLAILLTQLYNKQC